MGAKIKLSQEAVEAIEKILSQRNSAEVKIERECVVVVGIERHVKITQPQANTRANR